MDKPTSIWIVEAWRGIASLMVLWLHWGASLSWPMGPLAFGFTGVDLFFVISGFVFAPTILSGHVPAVRAYALRRLTRIYPAYLTALALYVLLAWLADKPLLYLPEHLLLLMRSRESVFYYNPVFWSLSPEIAFYTLVPILSWWLLDKQKARWRWPLLLVFALIVRLLMVPTANAATQNWAYLGLHHIPGLLIEFLLGIWVWQRQQSTAPRYLHSAIQAGLALLGWLLLAALFLQLTKQSEPDHSWRNGQLALGAALCFAWMLDACLTWPAPRGLLKSIGRWAGRLSYSLYLLHTAWLIPAHAWAARWGLFTGSILALIGLLLSCLAMYLLIEEPARQAGRRWGKRWSNTTQLKAQQYH